MKQMPQIQKFMTAMPHTIATDISIQQALEQMREFAIRHLPVLSEGVLVGILTDRDVKLAASFQGSAAMCAGDVMTAEPYSVLPEAPLNRVVSDMAEKKYGCAVVQQSNGKIVGIFTAVDALRVLAEQLTDFYKSSPLDAEVRTHV